MQEIKKVLVLNKLDYYITHLNIMNGIVRKMTPKEIEVLAQFMNLEVSVVGEYRFSPYAKKIIMGIMNIVDANLSNYIKSLIDKKVLKKDDNKKIFINPLFIPEENQQIYMFKIIKKQDDRQSNNQTTKEVDMANGDATTV